MHFQGGGYSILRRRKDGSFVPVHELFIAQPNGVAGVLRDVDSEMLTFVVGGELDSGIKRVAAGIFYFQRLAALQGGFKPPFEEGRMHIIVKNCF